MMNIILKAIMGFFEQLLGLFLTPIDAAIGTFFPNLSTYIQSFDIFITRTFSENIYWFMSLLPPNFKNLLGVYLTFMIALQGFIWVYHALVHILEVLKKLKFW